MMSKQAVAAMILSLTVGAASFPRAVSGQLPSASTATLATANNYTALARGFTAIATNPAGLGMPGNPGFSLASCSAISGRIFFIFSKVAEILSFESFSNAVAQVIWEMLKLPASMGENA